MSLGTALRHAWRAAAAVALAAILAAPSRAQENLPPGFREQEVMANLPSRDTVAILGLDLADAVTKQSVLAYRQKLYAYRAWSLDHTRKVYEWQHGKSEQVFWMVVVLVATGVLMSWQQFRSDLRRRERRHAPAGGAATPAEPATPPPTQFKASLQGIEVNSSLVGVVILTLSLAFFYLYIVHVYTISATN